MRRLEEERHTTGSKSSRNPSIFDDGARTRAVAIEAQRSDR